MSRTARDTVVCSRFAASASSLKVLPAYLKPHSPIQVLLEIQHFQPVLTRAKLSPTLRLYDLRHSCATLLLSAGENPKVVSERLGHASIVLTLDTYSHVLPSMQQAATEKLEQILRLKTSQFFRWHTIGTQISKGRSVDRLYHCAKVLYEFRLRGAGCRN